MFDAASLWCLKVMSSRKRLPVVLKDIEKDVNLESKLPRSVSQLALDFSL